MGCQTNVVREGAAESDEGVLGLSSREWSLQAMHSR